MNPHCFFTELYFSGDTEGPSLHQHESPRLGEVFMPPASFSDGSFITSDSQRDGYLLPGYTILSLSLQSLPRQ